MRPIRALPHMAQPEHAQILTNNDAPGVHGAEEAPDMPQAHAGVEMGDPKPTAVERGTGMRGGHCGTPARREDPVQHRCLIEALAPVRDRTRAS